MKIKDVIQESVYDWFTQRTAAQKQATSMAQDRQKTYRAAARQQALGQFKINPARAVTPTQSQQPQKSKFLAQFEIINTNPITVQWKNQQFQRDATTGQWVNFPAGKPVSQQMVNALDTVSPPPATTGRFRYPWQKQGTKE